MNEGLHHEVADLLLGRNGGPTAGTGFAVGPYPRLMLPVGAEPAPSERHGPGGRARSEMEIGSVTLSN